MWEWRSHWIGWIQEDSYSFSCWLLVHPCTGSLTKIIDLMHWHHAEVILEGKKWSTLYAWQRLCTPCISDWYKNELSTFVGVSFNDMWLPLPGGVLSILWCQMHKVHTCPTQRWGRGLIYSAQGNTCHLICIHRPTLFSDKISHRSLSLNSFPSSEYFYMISKSYIFLYEKHSSKVHHFIHHVCSSSSFLFFIAIVQVTIEPLLFIHLCLQV